MTSGAAGYLGASVRARIVSRDASRGHLMIMLGRLPPSANGVRRLLGGSPAPCCHLISRRRPPLGW